MKRFNKISLWFRQNLGSKNVDFGNYRGGGPYLFFLNKSEDKLIDENSIEINFDTQEFKQPYNKTVL